VDGALAHDEPWLIADRYRVERRLGKGGMALVYEVTDVSSGRKLALKQLLEELADGESSALQFRREFHTMAGLEHPQVVKVYDYGVAEGLPYYTMELLDGSDLRKLAPAEPERAGFLLRDLASALAYLHSRRFVHRDVSPANVRCTTDGRAKLMDFGVLTTPGFCRDIAGTPPHVAPEMVRGLPIDHRADIFSFGALAYWLLTGKKAYPARNFAELEPLWKQPIPRPSEIVPEIPSGLDELIMATLSLDPMARPRSAAEVIARLGGVLGLESAPELEVAHSYLASTALVGRSRELDTIRARIHGACEGRGSMIVLEGPSGIGKSRLLREARLEAQLAGATVVGARCQAHGGAYSVLRELAQSVLASIPLVAEEAARERDPIIVRAIPELDELVSRSNPARSGSGTHRDERVLLQRELTSWFLECARRQAIALTVDDIQRSDEASAAVLAAVARSSDATQLFCLATLRTDEASRVPMAIAAIRDASKRLRIHGLTEQDTEELVHATFGRVTHGDRLARWLFNVTGGNPLHVTEIPRQLVNQGTIRYSEGGWTIDEGFDESGLPRYLTDAMDQRIDQLPGAARALAETLSLHGGEMPLDLCVRLAAEGDEDDENEVFSALDDLLRHEVLEGGGASYRFCHDGVREALLRNLDDERKQQLHRRVGRALERAGQVGIEREGEVGWHLLQGGDESRGAELLERAGRRLYELQSFADAMPMLEAALDVFERQGHSPRRCLELRSMLLHGGVMADRPLVIRHADQTLAAYRDYGGLRVAEALGPVLGRRVGLLFGLATAGLRWLLTAPRRRGPTPIGALRELFKAAAYTNSATSTTWDVERLRRVAALLEPVAISKKKVSYASQMICSNYTEFRLGRFETLRTNARQALAALDADKKTPMAPLERLSARSVCHWSLGVSALWRGEPGYFEEVANLERTGVQMGSQIANAARLQLQVMYHRLRGEEQDAREEERQLELYMVETGSGGLFRVALVYYSSLVYGFLGDVMGLKSAVEELVRMRDEGFDFEFFIELARGEYYRERGNLVKAEKHIERALEAISEEHIRDRSAALLALGETRLALGQHERAKEAAEEGLRINEDPELRIVLARVRATRVLAYAETALGDAAGARARVEGMREMLASVDNPAALGMLEEARAGIAGMCGDGATYREAYEAASALYRTIGNSALLGRLQRIADPNRSTSGEGSSGSADEDPTATLHSTIVTMGDASASVASTLTSAQGPLERATRMLDVLMQASSGVAGFLYFRRGSTLKLAASIPEEEPPAGLREALRGLLQQLSGGEETTQTASFTVAAFPAGWHAIPLATRSPSGETIYVGAAVIRGGALDFDPPDEGVVGQVARLLVDAGDVTLSDDKVK
jgi:tetratricopeptide (TPR) repeat protein